jgi:uncharacterized SAM-binding protein YcdF (DUF218 family)
MHFLKSIIPLLQPLGLVWTMLTIWLIRQIWRRHWHGLWLPTSIWLVMTLFSCTPATALLLRTLEDKFPPVTISELQPADMIVCLGGSAEPSLKEPTRVNFNSSVDRVNTALALLAQKKAPVMVVTGGSYKKNGQTFSEADAAVAFLKNNLGVPLNILSLGICADTHDEALKIAALSKEKGLQRILLVTSATHMPRAMAAFKLAGVNASAVPCDYISSFNSVVDISWLHLPKTNSLQGFATWIHEIIGTWVYRWRGWI